MAFPNFKILKVEILIAKCYCSRAFSVMCLSKALHVVNLGAKVNERTGCKFYLYWILSYIQPKEKYFIKQAI